MSNLASRLKQLEKQFGKEPGGHEAVIKHRDGTITRFCDEDGPPWETLELEVAYGETEAEREEFDRMMRAIFDGELSKPSPQNRRGNLE